MARIKETDIVEKIICCLCVWMGMLGLGETAGQDLAGVLLADRQASEGGGAVKRRNLLFIMTDQQRFDTLSMAGNTVLKTPNIDRLGQEGAYFELAYSPCAVCGPARASMLTGRSVENSKVRTNMDADEAQGMPMPSYDELLVEGGYNAEYYGKWHAPLHRALKYRNTVTPAGQHHWENGPGMHTDYMSYLDPHFKRVDLAKNPEYRNSGMQENTYDLRPYKANPLDVRHGMEPVMELLDDRGETIRIGQPDQHGISTTPADFTVTAYQGRQTLDALESLAKEKAPFSLHCSFHYPHAPMIPSEPYASMFKPEDMIPPVSISDPMDNSPYIDENGRSKKPQYADPEKIKYMIANYYALIAEIDVWVGRILDRLEALGLAEDTLVIFTSDHGEMLGAHGMREKNVFYEESAHIPLLIRFPGRIRKGTVVKAPVSNIDLFATIFDYLGAGAHPSDGKSLRRYIEGTDTTPDPFAVTEWNWRGPVQPNLMVRTRRWKYFIPNTADSKVMNVLYDLENDPHEMNNLLGGNPEASRYREQAEYMKGLLLQWLEETGSPHLSAVMKRDAVAATK